MSDCPLIRAEEIKKSYKIGRGKRILAVNDVSFTLEKGETLALVGESGCGKSTLAKILMHLIRPDSGEIFFDGDKVSGLSEKAFRPYRRRIQMVFQDPASSLDPRMKIRDILSEPLNVWDRSRDPKKTEEKIHELIDMVEMKENCLERYPHQLSGGQKQRIGIARALAPEPEILLCDESVSALDVSVQAQILNLLKKLKREFSLSCLFISHDLGVVYFIADRVLVMQEGKICEDAPVKQLYSDPQHPFTKYLLSAAGKSEGKNAEKNTGEAQTRKAGKPKP